MIIGSIGGYEKIVIKLLELDLGLLLNAGYKFGRMNIC